MGVACGVMWSCRAWNGESVISRGTSGHIAVHSDMLSSDMLRHVQQQAVERTIVGQNEKRHLENAKTLR